MTYTNSLLSARTLQHHTLMPKHRQSGQALIYGIFMLIVGLAGLFFMFNIGQLSAEKTKLVNTTDAVAYTAGTMNARAFNFVAYTNRALIANEVLVAQMVSISSWAQYGDKKLENVLDQHAECRVAAQSGADPTTIAISGTVAVFKYDPRYFLTCVAIAYAEQLGTLDTMRTGLQTVPDLAKGLVSLVEVNKSLIMGVQQLSNSIVFTENRQNVAQAVADANYEGNGTVTVEVGRGSMSGGNLTFLKDDWWGATKKYDKDDRQRIKDVVVSAANTDSFVASRNWTSTAILPNFDCITALALTEFSSVKRRGGTEMIGFDEWQAEDTESYHGKYVRRNIFGIPTGCRTRESPTGWGDQNASPTLEVSSGGSFGGSPSTNPGAHSYTSSAVWGNYSGLPSFYDLSNAGSNPTWLDKNDPTIQLSVRVSRAKSQIQTTDANSLIKQTANAKLNNYDTKLANDEAVALSTAEIYFERPATYKNNTWQNLPEKGSLFNPYWQVRMIKTDNTDLLLQQLRQGAAIQWPGN